VVPQSGNSPVDLNVTLEKSRDAALISDVRRPPHEAQHNLLPVRQPYIGPAAIIATFATTQGEPVVSGISPPGKNPPHYPPAWIWHLSSSLFPVLLMSIHRNVTICRLVLRRNGEVFAIQPRAKYEINVDRVRSSTPQKAPS